MAKIFIFRHGQTTFNRDRIFCGWMDPDLTEDGIKECEQIAERLKSVKPTKAYTSDLKRAQHTLSIVLDDRKDKIPIIIDPRIKERNYGDLNGTSKTKTEKEHPKEYLLWHRSYDVRPPGGESLKDTEKRVLSFLKDTLPTLKKDDVVFISAHANSIRPMRRYFEKMSIDEMCSFEYTPAMVYEYEI